ncbi:MAG: hypothetical protein DRR03_02900 [Gammaproteobacteria bacterium]|nr:MAG: hypothetical protein DRR03_02900 [Gammaproteobacteria bacterium]
MDAHARDGFDRLTAIVPLASRQAALPTAWRTAHRAILGGYASAGRPPSRLDLEHLPGIDDAHALLTRLADDDLVVLDGAGEIVGAYPFTSEPTPHRVHVAGVAIHAMCAVDALAVAPMFDCATHIDSSCALSGQPVRVAMEGRVIAAPRPIAPRIGIHWATVSGHTAHSLCRQMLFLADNDRAAIWQAEAPEARRIYTLEQAVDLGAAFFMPLLT